MEVFTGGGYHELPNDAVLFPDTLISPFTDTFFDHHHFLPSPQPPQKLRPVRYNGRTFSDTKPPSWKPEPETDGGGNIPPNPSNLGESHKEPVNEKKRKRNSMKSYIKSMMNTVIEKQEEMYRNLNELLEKKETEHIMREQAWRQQELELAKKNELARKQEISRNLALISFIQKSLGEEIQIPNPLDATEKQCDDNQNQESCYCAGNDDIETTKENESAKKEKWDNINKYYRRTKENESARKSNACTYFKESEMLYKSDFTSANSRDEDSSVMGLK